MSARRRLALLAAEAFSVGIGLAVTWTRGPGTAYHRVLALVLDALYPRLDPLHSVLAVKARGSEMLFRVLVSDARHVVSVHAADITLGMVITLTLYAATHPLRRRDAGCWVRALLGATLVVGCVHVVTFMGFTQELLRGAQGATLSGDPIYAAIVRYDVLFENGGGVLIAVAVWVPWGVRWGRSVLRDESGGGDPTA